MAASGILQTGRIELPEGRERSRVHGEDAGPISVVAASQLGGPGLQAGEPVEVANEQVQPLVHLEARVEEQALLRRRRARR